MQSPAADVDGRHCHSKWPLQAAETAVGVIIFVINLGLMMFFAGVLVWRSKKGLAKVGPPFRV